MRGCIRCWVLGVGERREAGKAEKEENEKGGWGGGVKGRKEGRRFPFSLFQTAQNRHRNPNFIVLPFSLFKPTAISPYLPPPLTRPVFHLSSHPSTLLPIPSSPSRPRKTRNRFVALVTPSTLESLAHFAKRFSGRGGGLFQG